MTKYEELCKASAKAVGDQNAARERSWGYLLKLMQGLIECAGIPPDQIDYLKWNGLERHDSSYSHPEGGGKFSVPGAAVLDAEGFWRLGVRLKFPLQRTFFVVCAKDESAKASIKVGITDTPRSIDFGDADSARKLNEDIIGKILDSFGGVTKPAKKIDDFEVESTTVQ